MRRNGECRYRLRGLATTVVFAFCLVSATPAWTKNLGLLIGVSSYHSANIQKLSGPANDVTLIWRALVERAGVSPRDITVLADGLPTGPRFPVSSAEPSRSAILRALRDMVVLAGGGDTVLIYFSGHGSQQPVGNPDQILPERGNLDQVMLPIDAGDYDPSRKTIRNGIVDDEFGMALDAIRDRGANVWVVIDACHAGTMTRGAINGVTINGVTVRGVNPQRLGVPLAAESRASILRSASPLIQRSVRRPGALVGFFAVDSANEAIERPFEDFDPPLEGAFPKVGVFTFFFQQAFLATRGSVETYRQLAHRITRNMQQTRVSAPPMPSFEGDLDNAVLGAGLDTGDSPVWIANRDNDTILVSAGTLHGLTEGAVLSLSASMAKDAPSLAVATVAEANPTRSVAAVKTPAPPNLPNTLAARLSVPGVSFRFSVAAPPAAELAVPRARELVDALRGLPGESLKGAVDWVAAEAPANARLRVYGNRLWLLPADGDWIREDLQAGNPALRAFPLTPSFGLDTQAARIGEAIARMVQASNLVRISETAALAARSDTSAAPIKIGVGKLVRPDGKIDPYERCDKQKGPPADTGFRAVDAQLPVAVTHCDMIELTIENFGAVPIDANVMTIDSQSAIGPLKLCPVTIQPGTKFTDRIWIFTWRGDVNQPSSSGREHIVVVWAEQRNGIQADLCFRQSAVSGARGPQGPQGTQSTQGTRELSERPLFALLRAAMLAPRTRGAEIPEETPVAGARQESGIFHVTLQVTPP